MDLISVVMCVYNTPCEFLENAINSIVKQTYKNFEFIIVNDASTDIDTLNLLEKIKDSRITLINNKVNLGLTKSLNIGFNVCNGRYIARIDSDDISALDRLEKQLIYMKEKGFSVIGSYYSYLPYKSYSCFITENFEKQKIRMIFGNNGIVHSSAFIDRKVLKDKLIKYNENYLKSQDYGLWCEYISKGESIGICPEKLVFWRTSENQISVKNKSEQEKYSNLIRKDYINKMFSIDNKDLEYFVNNVNSFIYKNDTIEKEQVFRVLIRFIDQNKQKNPLLKKEIVRFWFLQSILRIKELHKFDFIFSKLMFWALYPQNMFYIIHSFIFERKKF